MEDYIANSIKNKTNINYVEILVKDTNNTDLTISNTNLVNNILTAININWSKENFDKLLLKFVLNKNYNYFKKTYDVYRYQNMEYLLYDEDKIMVHSNNLLDVFCNNNLIYNGYTQSTVPIHLFPSTKNIHEKIYITRITIKFNNRIFLNFEIQETNEKKTFYKIYINYNHSNKLDLNSNLLKINELIQIFSNI
jgi:hypothetical protein